MSQPKAWGYARVSTDEQFASRLSIDEQQAQIRAAVAKDGTDLGHEDCRLGEESASAYKLPFLCRPLGAKLSLAMNAGDHIYIAKLDRGFRTMSDAVATVKAWKGRGIHVHILDMPFTGTFSDELLLAVMSWAAEFESRRRSERMADAWRSAKRSGKHMGMYYAPYGFLWRGSRAKHTQRIVYRPEERAHMALLCDKYREGNLTFYQMSGWCIRNRIAPFDRRPEWSRKEKRGRIGTYYRADDIKKMVRAEGEMRYYELLGLTPEEAAYRWLLAYQNKDLPEDDEVEDAMRTYKNKKGAHA